MIFSQGFVLAVTMCREAWDDLKRFMRDKDLNGQVYKKLTQTGNTHLKIPPSLL